MKPIYRICHVCGHAWNTDEKQKTYICPDCAMAVAEEPHGIKLMVSLLECERRKVYVMWA